MTENLKCPLFSSLPRPDLISRLVFYDAIEKTTIFQNIISRVGRSKTLNDIFIFGGVWQDLKLKYLNISIIAAVTVKKV